MLFGCVFGMLSLVISCLVCVRCVVFDVCIIMLFECGLVMIDVCRFGFDSVVLVFVLFVLLVDGLSSFCRVVVMLMVMVFFSGISLVLLVMGVLMEVIMWLMWCRLLV